MTRLTTLVFAMAVLSFLFLAAGNTTYAEIGASNNTPKNEPDKPGPGGNTPNGIVDTGDFIPEETVLTLTPLETIGPRYRSARFEVHNGTPFSQIYIVSGFEEGVGYNLICPMTILDIRGYQLATIVTPDYTGFAEGYIRVPRYTPTGEFLMQALDIVNCDKSNVTETDL